MSFRHQIAIIFDHLFLYLIIKNRQDELKLEALNNRNNPKINWNILTSDVNLETSGNKNKKWHFVTRCFQNKDEISITHALIKFFWDYLKACKRHKLDIIFFCKILFKL